MEVNRILILVRKARKVVVHTCLDVMIALFWQRTVLEDRIFWDSRHRSLRRAVATLA